MMQITTEDAADVSHIIIDQSVITVVMVVDTSPQ